MLAAISAALLTHYLVTTPRGDITGGWSVNQLELKIGFLRLCYPFMAGMLLQRMHNASTPAMRSCGAACCSSSHWFCRDSASTRPDGEMDFIKRWSSSSCTRSSWQWVRASRSAGVSRARLCRFSGAISYPLYITHYSLIYIYTARVYDGKLTPVQGVLWGVLLFFTAILIAYACLKLYDEPVRGWLNRRFLVTGSMTV